MRLRAAAAAGVAGLGLAVLAAPAGAEDAGMPGILWQRDLPDQARGGVSVGEGAAYVALMDGTLRAYGAVDGQQKWKAEIGTAPQTAAAYSEGVVAVVDSRRRLLVFSASTGARLWESDLRGQASSDIGAGTGVMCTGEGNKSCAAFGAKDGAPLWQVAALGDIVSAPWVGEEAVVFGSTGHKLYVVAKLSGEVVKEVVLTGEVYGRVGADRAGAGDQFVFAAVGTHEGKLHAFSPGWRKRWEAKCRGVVRAAPLVVGNAVFAGTEESFLYAFKRDRGTMKWRTGIGGAVVEKLVLAGRHLVAGAGGALKFVNARNGEIVHAVEAGGAIQGMDILEGRIVAVTSVRRLLAVGVRAAEKASEQRDLSMLASVVLEPERVNPRRRETAALTFSMLKAGPLLVEVLDSRGKRVKLLTERRRARADTYRFVWNAVDDSGIEAVPGIYRIRVKAGDEEVFVGLDVMGRR